MASLYLTPGSIFRKNKTHPDIQPLAQYQISAQFARTGRQADKLVDTTAADR
jgi:hypothetical protein